MSVIKTLIEVANACDEKGLRKEADEIDSIIIRLAHRPVGAPYVDDDGLEKQKYVDGKGRVYTIVLTPEEKEEQSWYDWAREKAQNLFQVGPVKQINEALKSNQSDTDSVEDKR